MNARLLESPPAFLDAAEAEEVLIRAKADVAGDGSFGERWVVVDRAEVRVFDGTGPEAVQRVPIAELVRCRSESSVGGGAVVLERAGEAPLRVCHSQSQAAKFSEVVRGIEQLREGKAFHINGHVERNRCSTCRRLLPERDGICPACIRKTATLARLAVRLWPYRLRTVVVAVASLFVTAAALAPPLVTAMIVDDVLVPADRVPPIEERLGLLALLVAGLVGIRVVSWAGEWIHGWNATWLGARVTADIRAELYHRLEMLSLPFYDKHPIGSLIARATRDVQMLQGFLIDGVPYLVTNLLTLVGILALMLGMSLHLSLYVLLPVPLILLWGAFYWSRLRMLFTRLMQSWSRLTDRTVETLTGIRVVKSFAQEAREIASFNVANAGIRAAGIRVKLHQGIFFATMALITALGMMLVWGVGGQQVLNGAITLGTLVAFYSYMWMFLGPIQWLGEMNDQMSRAFASAERIFEVIDAPPEGAAEGAVAKRPALAGHVRLRDVTFGYDKSKPVLKGVDLELRRGEMVGIVGRSGVGKTTIVNLIARFYDPDRGSVEIDGGGCARDGPGPPPLAHRHGAAGAVAVLGHHCGQHRLWQARCHIGRDHGRGPSRQRPQLHHDKARRLRDAGGRERHWAVRRREAADLDRPRHPARSPHPHLRRGHGIRGCPDGAAHSSSARTTDAGTDHHRHRPSPLHPARRESHRRHGGRSHQ